MLDAAREARSFATDKTRDDLNRNRMLVLSLLKDIEVIGEAASQISAQARSANPQIPWQDLVGMRNRLVHAYFDVDLDVVWDTVCKDLPPLIDRVERALLQSEPADSSKLFSANGNSSEGARA
jgi:uncharacterized protein with HEPN domain